MAEKKRKSAGSGGAGFHAWNPGLASTIPRHLQNRISLFAAPHAYADYADVMEASRLTGFDTKRLADLRPERMVVHELLIRVTADCTVPDGPDYEYLGLSMRGMTRTIFDKHIARDLPRITAEYESLRGRAREAMSAVLDESRAAGKQTRGGFLQSFLRRNKAKPPPADGTAAEAGDIALVDGWRKRAEAAEGFDAAILRALADAAGGIISQRGRLGADKDVLCGIALRLFCADYGVLAMRRIVAPLFLAAVKAEGFRLLPHQSAPVILNVKGASAAGKSTVRPRQRALAERLGIAWEDFALISPDYWRKYLLDYEALGEDSKYAAMLTGRELEVIDAKLDDYMVYKARAGKMPHLLVDRFRFDSFTVDSSGEYKTRLLTRFGHTVFLFFIVTHPAHTVERAWLRGLSTGRFKAVDDLLHHNFEAYTGMADLFFSWAGITGKTVHYEFLDNDVPQGSPPRTIAYGKGGDMVILDPVALGNIDRFREVNIDAATAEEIFTGDGGCDHAFLRRLAAKIPRIDFADFATGRAYGRMEHGIWQWRRAADAPQSMRDDTALCAAIGWQDSDIAPAQEGQAKADSIAPGPYTIGMRGGGNEGGAEAQKPIKA